MLENKMPTQDDWRRQGQVTYLRSVKLVLKDYQPYRAGWDHDHCEFCGSRFSLDGDDIRKGYSTEDRYHWICIDCFNDFKSEFSWQIEK